jgi:hypothetical protein
MKEPSLVHGGLADKPWIPRPMLELLVQGAEIDKVGCHVSTILLFQIRDSDIVPDHGTRCLLQSPVNPVEILKHACIQDLRFRWTQYLLD